MKTNEEKMDEELTELFTNYGQELKRIEKEAKENGEWLEIGLDSNQHLFKKLNDEVKKKEKMIIEKYKEQKLKKTDFRRWCQLIVTPF